MNRTPPKKHFVFLGFTALVILNFLMPIYTFATGLPPRNLKIIVEHTRDDFKIMYIHQGINYPLPEVTIAWETIYLHSSDMSGYLHNPEDRLQLEITNNNQIFRCTVEAGRLSGDKVVVINAANGTVGYGKPIGRTVLLITLRTFVVLLAGWAVLQLLKYKKSQSYIICASILVFVYGICNLYINASGMVDSHEGSMPEIIFHTLAASLAAFLCCLALFPLFLREQGVRRALKCAACTGALAACDLVLLVNTLPV